MKTYKLILSVLFILMLVSCSSWTKRDYIRAGVQMTAGAASMALMGTDVTRGWDTWVVDSMVTTATMKGAGVAFDAVEKESRNSQGKQYKDLNKSNNNDK